MSGPMPVQDQAADYAQLAGRIAKHLQQHPNDARAKADLHYVVTQMRGPAAAANAADVAAAEGPPNPHPVASTLSGVTQGLLDIPGGILNAVIHPVQTVQGLESMNPLDPQNLGAIAQAFTQGVPEGLDAAARHTPLNLGYAPERALLEATGAKSDTPASATEQWRRGTNVASLGLLGVNPKTAFRMATRPVRGLLQAAAGPLLDRLLPPNPAPAPAAPVAAAAAGTPEELAVAKALGVPVEMVRGRVGADALRAAPPAAAPVARPVEPIPGSGGYGFTAEGPPTPPIPTTPTIREMQQGLIGPKTPPAAQAGLLGSPFAQTPAEAGETVGAQSAAARAKEAARTAYNVAIAGGQEPAQALEASRRAAAMSGGPTAAAIPRAIGKAMPFAQLKLLLTLPADQFEAASAMFPEAILRELRALRLQEGIP